MFKTSVVSLSSGLRIGSTLRGWDSANYISYHQLAPALSIQGARGSPEGWTSSPRQQGQLLPVPQVNQFLFLPAFQNHPQFASS